MLVVFITFEEGLRIGVHVPWSRVLIKSSGCRESVVAIPAVNPAMVSTTDDDKPSLPVMNTLSAGVVWLTGREEYVELGRWAELRS
jgi:hypothetical protein